MVNPTPTSFIPKTTLPKPAYKAKGMGFLITISLVILLASGGSLAGAFAYKGFLESDVATLEQDLEKVQREFEQVSIRGFSETAAFISAAKSAIESHVAPSEIFKLLEENTLPAVRFSRFAYQIEKERYAISMDGEAAGFTALAEQALVFESNPNIESFSLSNLSLKSGGIVGFTITMILNQNLIKYAPE